MQNQSKPIVNDIFLLFSYIVNYTMYPYTSILVFLLYLLLTTVWHLCVLERNSWQQILFYGFSVCRISVRQLYLYSSSVHLQFLYVSITNSKFRDVETAVKPIMFYGAYVWWRAVEKAAVDIAVRFVVARQLSKLYGE